jgi:hypothetical protein
MILGDPERLRARISEDGYVFMRGLLDPDAVRAVGLRGLGHLQAAGWTAPSADPVTATPLSPPRAIKMRDAFGLAGYREIVADTGFTKVPFDSPLADLMAQIMGPTAFCYPLKIPRVVYPASMVPRHPGNFVHMDYNSVQDMFTCWVPLGDVPRSLGGLAINPSSQRTSSVHVRPLDELPAGWLTTDYSAGDVLVFHCMTAHAALPNREERMRFSAEYRWQFADQPAPRRNVIGPFGNEIGSRLFSGQSWWHSVPEGLELFDDTDSPTPTEKPPPSRFVTF